MFELFYYRPTLWHHSIRVSLLVNELFDFAKDVMPGVDWKKAQVMALIHDDAEMITGDVQLGHKQRMTEEQLKAVEKNEEEAIVKLAEIYPKKIAGFEYASMLKNVLYKDTVEAQVVGFVDKMDAYCESLHELFAGNISSLRAVINYVGILKDIQKKFPNLKPIFDKPKSFLTTTDFYTDPWRVHAKDYIHLGKPHSPETIHLPTQFILYNKWKQLVIDNLGEEGVSILTERVE